MRICKTKIYGISKKVVVYTAQLYLGSANDRNCQNDPAPIDLPKDYGYNTLCRNLSAQIRQKEDVYYKCSLTVLSFCFAFCRFFCRCTIFAP